MLSYVLLQLKDQVVLGRYVTNSVRFIILYITNSESTLHGKLFINTIKMKGTTRFINIPLPVASLHDREDPTCLRGWSCWTVLGYRLRVPSW